MTPERWKQIERIFHSVLEVQASKRTAVLDASCGGDLELRREVEALLDAEEQSSSLLSSGKLPRIHPPSPALTHEWLGKRFGHYEIVAPIGAGAMGEVYRAHDLRLSRDVAVKVLPARYTGDAERVSRFMREAKASSALNHPNIVTVFDGGEEHDTCYIATELIEGTTLRQRLAAGPVDVPLALDIALQCGMALDAAHRAGVLHRDIKPENIMLRPDGVVKVVDFGLARIVGGPLDSDRTRTQAGAVMGTPRYMSPEQARGEKADTRGDVFSLGAVLYEMLSGEPAFPGRSSAEVLAALLTFEPPPPGARRRDVPRELDAIVARALAKNPAQRYSSVAELVTDLRGVQRQLAQAAASGATMVSRRTVLGTLAVGVAAGGAAWYWSPVRRPAPVDVPLRAVPLTSFAGLKDYPSLSPDGLKVAFSWNGGRGGQGGQLEREIYVKPVGSGDPVRLTESTSDNRWPAWSPDGRFIAFARVESDYQHGIYVMPASGGPERKLATGGNGLTWTADGQALIAARLIHGNRSAGLFAISLQSGAQRDLTRPEGAYDERPAASPDGRWIAFTRGGADDARQVFVVPADGGQARSLKTAPSQVAGIAWTPDSREIVYSALETSHNAALFRIPREGGGSRRLMLSMDRAINPSISSRTGQLAYTEIFSDTNIYRSTGPRFTTPEALIVSSREDHTPALSPDGKWLAFVSGRTGDLEVWIARVDGSGARQVTELRSRSVGTPRWSPDGASIVFDANPSGDTDIFVIPSAGGAPRRITHDASQDYLPAWSPDGRWIYFTSNRSGRGEVWKIPGAGGTAVPVTREGAREALPALDGKVLYYTKGRPEGQIWSVPVEGGAESLVPELAEFRRISRAWGVLSSGIYFISRQDGPDQEVRFFDFATRRVATLVRLANEPVWTVPCLALSPDGRTLFTVRLDHEVNDFMLVESFR